MILSLRPDETGLTESIMNTADKNKLPHIDIFFEKNLKDDSCISKTKQCLSDKSDVNGIKILVTQGTQTDNLKHQKSTQTTTNTADSST